jgi:FkbM family methyltransferase
MINSSALAIRPLVRRKLYDLLTHAGVVWCVDKVLAIGLRDRVPQVRHGLRRVDVAGGVVTPMVKSWILWGYYELPEIRAVQRYLRRDLDVIELGSSLGIVASHIARRIDSSRTLLCVEANPRLLWHLEANARRDSRGLDLRVVHGAIDYTGAADGLARFALDDDNLCSQVAAGQASREVVTVPATTLSRLIAEHRIGEYALVVDIEGAEAALLDRDREALRSCRQLIIELHPTTCDGRHVSIDDLYRTLTDELGFRCVDRANYHDVYVFERRSEAEESSL